MIVVFAMFVFSLSMSISPGPVNFVCLSSGINHGFIRSLPFVSGATIGFTLLLLAIGLGLGVVADNTPLILTVLNFLGSGFICFLGFKIMTSQGLLDVDKHGLSIPTFNQGFLLQWLNPKAWMACIAGTSSFNTANSLGSLTLFVCIYFVVCYASIAGWALAGNQISRYLNKHKYIRALNILMGSLLLLVGLYLLTIEI